MISQMNPVGASIFKPGQIAENGGQANMAFWWLKHPFIISNSIHKC